jgi:hypothetical protein
MAMMKMRLRGLVLTGVLSSGAALAQTSWFTVLGDPGDPSVTTVEVSPTPVRVTGVQRVMKVRVNRPEVHLSSDGIAHRSYMSEVLFDCSRNTARFVSASFYREPLWSGEPVRSESYPPSDQRFMKFRDIEPNPAMRIVRAACQTTNARRD